VINSNLGRISHRFRDGQVSVKNAHVSYPRPFNPEFENVPLVRDGWNFAYPSLTHMVNYSCKKFCLLSKA